MNVILLTLSAVAVRYAVMLKQGTAWFDEAFSLHFASMPLREMLGFLAHDVHPPLHAILLNGWLSVFGANITSARWMSVLLGAAAVPIMMRLAKRFGRTPSLIAGAVTAFSPILLFHSADARMYPLLLLLVAVATDAFLRMLEGKKKYELIWAISIGLALFTHITAVIPFGIMCVYGWVFLKQRIRFVKVALLAAAPAALWIGYFTLGRIGFGGNEWQLSGASSGGSAISRFLDLFVFEAGSWIRALLLPLLIVLVVSAILKFRQHKGVSFIVEDTSTTVTRFLLISGILPFLVFLPVHVSTTKYLFVAFPALITLIAFGAKRVFGHIGAIKTLFIYLLIIAFPVYVLMTERRIRWDDAMTFIEQEEVAGDIVYATWFASELPMQMYYHGISPIYSTYTHDPALSFDERLVRHAGQLINFSEEALHEMTAVALEAPHVFLVTGEVGLLDQPVFRWYLENGWRLSGEYKSNTLSPIVLKLENPEK